MIRTMQPDPIILALANPVPEIMPEEALVAGAAIVATGRFDYPNQCNNVLAFPALMRAAIDTRAMRLDREVYLAAARSIAAEISDAALSPSSILPSPLSPTLYPNVAEATAQAIVRRGLARRDPGRGYVANNTRLLRKLVAERQKDLQRRVELQKCQMTRSSCETTMPSHRALSHSAVMWKMIFRISARRPYFRREWSAAELGFKVIRNSRHLVRTRVSKGALESERHRSEPKRH